MTEHSTKQTIGVGLLGTGFIGPAHVEALRRNGIQVLGLAEKLAENLQGKSGRAGHSRTRMTRSKNMLADPDIDVVHLATPNYLHHPACQSRFAGRQACHL